MQDAFDTGRQKLNVLYISPYSSFRLGGQKSLVLSLTHLNRQLIRPAVLLSEPGEIQEVLTGIDCPVYVIPQPFPHRRILWSPRSAAARAWYVSVKRIAGLVRDLDIHVIHAETPEHVITCKVAALVAFRVDLRLAFYARLTARHRLDPWVERLSDGIVAVSEGAAARFPRAGRDARRVRTIYNPVDCRRFRPAISREQIRRDLGLPTLGFMVCFVGQLTTTKGLFDLVQAWGLFKQAGQNAEATLLMVGSPMEGGIIPRLEEAARNLTVQDSIRFVGYRADVERWMQASDVLVLVSHEGSEGLGRVVCEAMACGTVPVATDISGVREAITPAEGVLVPEQDPQALADALELLAHDEPHRRSLAERGPPRARSMFDPLANARALEEFYMNLAG